MKTSLNRTAYFAILCGALLALPAAATSIYDTIPSPQPGNVVSLGYQATQTSEFGSLIEFGGTGRALNRVTVLMSDWALASSYPTMSGPTWNHDITLNLYNVDNSEVTPAPGTLIATQTRTFAIPWRPEADPTCGSAWRAADGNCWNGFAFTIAFDLAGVTVPDQIIYGVAFNTNTWGYNPIGEHGPYESLNFGLTTQAPSTGSNPDPGTVYWNTKNAGYYTDGGAAGAGIFRQDTNWSYSGTVNFEVVPEPGTWLLLGLGLLGLASFARRSPLK